MREEKEKKGGDDGVISTGGGDKLPSNTGYNFFAVILYINVLKYVFGKLVKFASNITGNE